MDTTINGADVPNEKRQQEALKELFFDPAPEEYYIDTEAGNTFAFTIRGLSQFEVESIGAEISKEVKLDPITKEPVVHVDQSQFNLQFIVQGISRAACNGEIIPWNEETVKKLRSNIRDELLEQVKRKSDGLADFKKNSLSS